MASQTRMIRSGASADAENDNAATFLTRDRLRQSAALNLLQEIYMYFHTRLIPLCSDSTSGTNTKTT